MLDFMPASDLDYTIGSIICCRFAHNLYKMKCVIFVV